MVLIVAQTPTEQVMLVSKEKTEDVELLCASGYSRG